ncbi:hypothetical protein L3X38_037963 [Prunus dulcis]|uniref:Uncharacterized protein n=1 Tax=Prunus dulcis TaxID=3755 RepID=A0AAD4V451_PRUDU|nr:hypothetical protein L3X38_037963 [Prunus dulcis]
MYEGCILLVTGSGLDTKLLSSYSRESGDLSLSVTLLSLLSACSHSGLVAEGGEAEEGFMGLFLGIANHQMETVYQVLEYLSRMALKIKGAKGRGKKKGEGGGALS